MSYPATGLSRSCTCLILQLPYYVPEASLLRSSSTWGLHVIFELILWCQDLLLILLCLGQVEILIHCSGFWSIIIKLFLTCINVINLYKDWLPRASIFFGNSSLSLFTFVCVVFWCTDNGIEWSKKSWWDNVGVYEFSVYVGADPFDWFWGFTWYFCVVEPHLCYAISEEKML